MAKKVVPFDFEALVNLCRDVNEAMQDRAAYGSGLLNRLSEALRKGFSARSLRQFRAFYLNRKAIRQTVSAKLLNEFTRGWSQYVELPTIGIVLCHRKNDALVELTLPKEANIFASRYQLYLPSKEDLKTELEQIARDLTHGVQP